MMKSDAAATGWVEMVGGVATTGAERAGAAKGGGREVADGCCGLEGRGRAMIALLTFRPSREREI